MSSTTHTSTTHTSATHVGTIPPLRPPRSLAPAPMSGARTARPQLRWFATPGGPRARWVSAES